MTEKEKNMLASLLLTLDLQDLKADEKIATNDHDFEKLQRINKVSAAVQIILEYLDSIEEKIHNMWHEGYPPEEIAHHLGVEKDEVRRVVRDC